VVSALQYELARPDDAESIQALLRQTAMEGRIKLSFESQLPHEYPEELSPKFSQTLVGREKKSAQIWGVSTRSGYEMFVNGEPALIGYVGLLRVAPAYQHGIPLKLGIRLFKQLHQDGRVPYYLTSIMADNKPAIRMLAANRPGFLTYTPYARLVTHTILSRKTRPVSLLARNVSLRSATAGDIPGLIAHLTHWGQAKQFSPVWNQHTLFHPDLTPGLQAEDFILALQGDEIVACAAVWDQQLHRKIIVLDYEQKLRRMRRLLNPFSRLLGQPKLPPAGSELPHAILSMVAVKNDDTRLFQTLLAAALDQTKRRGIDLLMAGFPEHSRFETLIRENYRTQQSPSLIYLVSIPEDNIKPLEKIDDREPGLEIAFL
jgi:hypothetical protein